MKPKVPGAPRYPRGVPRDSDEYRAWAAAYARARRAEEKQSAYFEEEPVPKIARAALDLLLDLSLLYKEGPRVEIPERLWPSFATALRRCGRWATIQELDLLRRARSDVLVLELPTRGDHHGEKGEVAEAVATESGDNLVEGVVAVRVARLSENRGRPTERGDALVRAVRRLGVGEGDNDRAIEGERHVDSPGEEGLGQCRNQHATTESTNHTK